MTRPEWFQDLLDKAEADERERKEKWDRIKADQALGAIAVLEKRIDEINQLADDETRLINDYRSTQTERLNRQISWLSWNLEQFIRSTDQRTIELVRGVLKLRLGRPKVSVVDLEAFKKVAEREGLMRTKPSESEPDIGAIQAYCKRFGYPPLGVSFTPAVVNFSFSTKGESNGEDERNKTKAGSNGNPSESETAQEQTLSGQK